MVEYITSWGDAYITWQTKIFDKIEFFALFTANFHQHSNQSMQFKPIIVLVTHSNIECDRILPEQVTGMTGKINKTFRDNERWWLLPRICGTKNPKKFRLDGRPVDRDAVDDTPLSLADHLIEEKTRSTTSINLKTLTKTQIPSMSRIVLL